MCRFEFTDEFKAWLSTSTPSGSVRSWSHIFCGASAHIGLFELPRTSVSGHHRRTGAALDVGATLAGSSDENLGPTTGMCSRPLTALGYVSLGKASKVLKFPRTLFLAGISFLKKHSGIFFWPLLIFRVFVFLTNLDSLVLSSHLSSYQLILPEAGLSVVTDVEQTSIFSECLSSLRTWSYPPRAARCKEIESVRSESQRDVRARARE